MAVKRLGGGQLHKILYRVSLEQNLDAFKASKKAAAADAFELANLKELKSDYLHALSFYKQAVDLAPENSAYLKALQNLENKLEADHLSRKLGGEESILPYINCEQSKPPEKRVGYQS